MDPEPTAFGAPWLRPDLLPQKANPSPYGYLMGDEQIGCSQEELIERCRETKAPQVVAVWAPETTRVVTVLELPFLQEAIRQRSRSAIHSGMLWAFIFLIFCLPIFGGGSSESWKSEQFTLLLLSFAVIPLVHGCWQLWQLRRDTPEKAAQDARSLRYGMWVQSRRKPMTWLMLALFAAIFLVQLVGGVDESIQLAGLTKDPFSWSEGYRFLSATLMHGSMAHIVMNGAAFLALGTMAEALLGKAGLALTFLGSALGGSVLSFLCLPETSVGASGGIMGLIGCFAVVGYRFREVLPGRFGRQMLAGIALMAVVGFIARHVIDNAAHAGGLAAGAAIGWALIHHQERLPIPLSLGVKLLGWVSLAMIVGTAVWIMVLLLR